MKSVLISIRPEMVQKIVNGEKTIEVRKTAPKEEPFKAYIYCTKAKSQWRFSNYEGAYENSTGEIVYAQQHIIGEFVCDKVYDFVSFAKGKGIALLGELISPEMFCKESCLTEQEICCYIGNKDGYGWHISDLKIYDKPKELSEFYKLFKYDGDGIICGTREEMNDIYEFDCETVFGKIYPDFSLKDFDCKHCPKARDFYRLTRPPQSWCYVEELEK